MVRHTEKGSKERRTGAVKTEKTWTGLERPSPIDKSLVKRVWKLIPELWYYLWLAGHKHVLRLAV